MPSSGRASQGSRYSHNAHLGRLKCWKFGPASGFLVACAASKNCLTVNVQLVASRDPSAPPPASKQRAKSSACSDEAIRGHSVHDTTRLQSPHITAASSPLVALKLFFLSPFPTSTLSSSSVSSSSCWKNSSSYSLSQAKLPVCINSLYSKQDGTPFGSACLAGASSPSTAILALPSPELGASATPSLAQMVSLTQFSKFGRLL